MNFLICALCAASLLFLSGCNSFSWVDTPSGDVQVLAKARACFDQGDFECASKYYGQLSQSYQDIALSETVYEMLAENGASSGIFIKSIIKDAANGGKLITGIAESLTSVANQNTRLAYFHAYQLHSQITNSASQGLIQFLTSLTLICELFAEVAESPGILKQSDFVSNPTLCKQSGGITGCTSPASNKLQTGNPLSSLKTASDSDLTGPPSLTLIFAALQEMDEGLKKVQASGDLNSGAGGLADQLLTIPPTVATDPLFRYTLIVNQIGDPQ